MTDTPVVGFAAPLRKTARGEERVSLVVSIEWARLLARLQQLRQHGRVVVIDLDAMTLRVVGDFEQLTR